jgi:peptide-methionine (S)-S-oxide reductase
MEDRRSQKATFAAGCFWGVEETFRNIKGVISTVVGYTGGHTERPSYKEVCTDTTGHAEAVEVTFDPDVVSYEALLKAFWESHDPTTADRQGPDIGSQYRSAIFFHNSVQERLAKDSKVALESSGVYSQPVVTEIVAASVFYPAEEYHQKYLMKRGAKYCG